MSAGGCNYNQNHAGVGCGYTTTIPSFDEDALVMNTNDKFAHRVEDYQKYRPGYPAAIVDMLEKECGLTHDATLVDLGSGTGLLTELFLGQDYAITGVEPNDAMRGAGEARMEGFGSLFTSVNGSAEATTLADSSVDFIVAGQAFHWFDLNDAPAEFRRVLKPGGWVVLIWNERRTKASAFMSAFELVMGKFGVNYPGAIKRRLEPDELRQVLRVDEILLYSFENRQMLTKEGLMGRVRSASYCPLVEDARYEFMMKELRGMFEIYAFSGKVTLEYDTQVFVAKFP